MALIGSTPVFNIFKDDWTLYTEILEQFFEINSIDDNKKCAYLISVIGQDCYKILSEICYPEIPKNKSYDELCNLLSKHFQTKYSVFVIRNKFYRASQYPNESITLWFNRIKRLSKECRFADNIESILVDRFITGLKYAPLDGFFNEMDPISLDKAFNMALEREKSGKEDEKHENNFRKNPRRRGNVKKEITEKKNPVEKKTKYPYDLDENERRLFLGSDYEKYKDELHQNIFKAGPSSISSVKNMKTQPKSDKNNPVVQKELQNKASTASNETKKLSWKAGSTSINSVKVDPIGVVPVQQMPKNVQAQQFQNALVSPPPPPPPIMANNDVSGAAYRKYVLGHQLQQNSTQGVPSFSGYIPQEQRNRNVKTKSKKDDSGCVLS